MGRKVARGRLMAREEEVEASFSLRGLRSWAEIKRMIENSGVTDSDLIFQIEIGPVIDKIFVNRERIGRSKQTKVEIGDHPTVAYTGREYED